MGKFDTGAIGMGKFDIRMIGTGKFDVGSIARRLHILFYLYKISRIRGVPLILTNSGGLGC